MNLMSHHGGYFEEGRKCRYIGGEEDAWLMIDPNYITIPKIN